MGVSGEVTEAIESIVQVQQGIRITCTWVGFHLVLYVQLDVRNKERWMRLTVMLLNRCLSLDEY